MSTLFLADMVDFFRYSGLSVKQSRACAEQSVSMDANSPRKLFKYLGTIFEPTFINSFVERSYCYLVYCAR